MRILPFWLVLWAGLSGCAAPERVDTNEGAVPARSSAPAVAPTTEVTKAGCARDADCAWDHPCTPSRCVPASEAARVPECEESAPPPGTCGCEAAACVVRPKAPAGCGTDYDCALDASREACALRPGAGGSGPIYESGSYCRCDKAAGACTFERYDPVPCQTYKDCSWELNPLRPVPSSLKPRPKSKPVRPCVDGEKDSVCQGPAGKKTCRIVAWGC
jgi:hypothetical protein